MIFKKIYTFSNDYFNGKKTSKVLSTLIFTLIFSGILFCSAYLADVSAQDMFPFDVNEEEVVNHELLEQKLNAQNTASREQVDANMEEPGSATYNNSVPSNEFYILYTKAGLQENKIYTSYLPPKNTYNKDPATEHSRDYCGSMGQSGLKMIGRDCMIKIPFDCDKSAGNFPALINADKGVNCLIYSDVFHDTSTGKKLNPRECANGMVGDKESCLSTQKPPCHETDNPILGINCKLAPCNSIPNQQYRRPGVNCLADCNDTSNKHISEPRFFMEGFNCLKSCDTSTSTLKTIGQDCVLKLDEYVMPLCYDHPNGVTKHFNKTILPKQRENCLDVIDLPICDNPLLGSQGLPGCVNECTNVTDPLHNKNCVNFNSALSGDYTGSINKTCHSYNNLASLDGDSSCTKIDCDKLSNSELTRSLNTLIEVQGNKTSSAKYCNPTKYTNFSLNQFVAINSRQENPHLKDYLLDIKPCYSRGDTEEIETILSSLFYGNSAKTKIKYLQDRAIEAFGESASSLTGKNRNIMYYNPKRICPLDNVSQRISCGDYWGTPNHIPPYDCNSTSYCPDCPNQRTNICGLESDEYCYKIGINCNNPVNKIYPVCLATSCGQEDSDEDCEVSNNNGEDEYVSWFFRPNVPEDAIKDGRLVKMEGYPVDSIGNANGDLYMSKDDMAFHDYGKNADFLGFFASREITPPSEGWNLGIPGVGAGNICGMAGDYRGTPNDDAGYFKGEVKTTYEGNKVSHEVEICLRYVSGSTPGGGSCGHRSCKTTCLFGSCTKLCGLDVCKKLTLIEGSNQNCGSNDFNFKNHNTAECIKDFETNLDKVSKETRVRIYKPNNSSNYICAVLEFRGITTDRHKKPYFDGSEYFEVPDPNDPSKPHKKMCVSGNYFLNDSFGCVGGVDSNGSEATSAVWRTSKIIKYIMAPKVPYIDQYGIGPNELSSNHIDFKTKQPVNQTIGRVKYNIKRYFEKSDCIQHKQRVAAPPFPSIATPSNSERLFLPLIKIDQKCKIATPGIDCENVSETDFFQPAITIHYGRKEFPNSFLSADLTDPNTNYKIIKIENASSSVSHDYIIKAANTGITGIDIQKTVFIKKEFAGSQPKLCLYKKTASELDPTIFKEEVIECVNRKRATRASIISSSPSPAYTHLDFFAGFLRDGGGDLPRQSFQFSDMRGVIKNKEKLKVCLEIPGQGFPICIKRDECSLLNNECVKNEILLIESKKSSDIELGTIQQQEFVSDYCKKELLVKCNLRKGYALTPSNQTLNTSIVEGEGFNAPKHPNYHGWFNEFCIVSGIEKLDDPGQKIYVERNVNENEQKGSCKKDPNCSTCDDNRCLRNSCCKIVQSSALLSSLATPHELGLCYELNVYLKSCSAISYEKNSDISDPLFMGESFLNMIPPHSSHQKRFVSSISPGSNHAEFEVAYAGSTALRGKCVGFYKNIIENNYPSANCNSDGVWYGFSDSCEMYTCPAKELPISNPGANSSGRYPASYDSTNSPIGSERGSSEGYANWNEFKKTTLLKESSSATSCIIGYARVGASNASDAIDISEISDATLFDAFNNYKSKLTPAEQVMAITPALNNRAINKAINSLYGKYTGFTGGTLPTRNCNQRGVWETVTNPCVRITCPPIHFDEPAEAGAFNMNDYTLEIIPDNGRNVIRSLNPLHGGEFYGAGGMPTKAKFKITTTTDLNGPVYLSVAPPLFVSNNSFVIKESSGSNIWSNISTITTNKNYVVELFSPLFGEKYWRKIDNANDDVLISLWQKSGGASFDRIGYALRSDKFNYIVTDPNDPGDPMDQYRVTGVCNLNMEFRSLGLPPQLTCDSNGNWSDLINPCTSDCKAVSDPIASNVIHGFATWNTSEATVGQSKVEESGGCLPGYKPYPYSPLYDNEGTKKDFGIGAVGIDGTKNSVFMTSDSYDATAEASDGATFVATAGIGENLASSNSNNLGTYYNLKIKTSNPQSAAFDSSQEGVQTLFYLFNTDARLTMDAGNQNVWSKINFSSFGTPEYFSTKDITENPACRSPYSKLIFANKCIGKTTCNIGLSDFTSYDTANTCFQRTNPGNGGDGQQNNNAVDDSYGSGGGGGGGNKPGYGGSPTGSININGASGSSFYDQSFHLNRPTLSDALNKGLKVDLKVADAGQFRGQNGWVKIIESVDQVFSEADDRTVNYAYLEPSSSNGEQTHTVTTGSTDQDIYIKYEMSGAGGGGGGQGLTQGADGASGSKMMGGIFKVKKGDVLKIYVGGGGGAGKTKCAPPPAPSPVSFLDPKITQPAIEIIEPAKKTNLAIKMLENYQLNPDQIITQNTKIIDRDSAIKSPLAKIFSKISNIFISEGHAAYLTCGTDFFNGQTRSVAATACPNYDKAVNIYSCNCPITRPAAHSKDLMGVRGFNKASYGNYNTHIDCTLTYSDANSFINSKKCTYDASWTNKIKSFSLWDNTRVRFNCGTGEIWSDWFFSNTPTLTSRPCGQNGGNLDESNLSGGAPRIKKAEIEYYKTCNETFVNRECQCNTNRYWNGTQCADKICTVPTSANLNQSSVKYSSTTFASTPTTLTCKSGFSPSSPAPTYTCTENGATASISGSCTAITCSTLAGNGYGAKQNLAFTQTDANGNITPGDITCGGASYPTYSSTTKAKYTCTGSGTFALTVSCSCASGFAKNALTGVCEAITCTTPAGNGYLEQNALAFTHTGQTGAIPCNQTGYSGSASYTCSVATVTGAATNIGNCGCALGYAKATPAGVCNPIDCRISGTGYDRNVSGIGDIACDPGYYGTINYTCTGAKTSATPAGTFTTLGSCTRIECNLPAEAYSNISPVSKHGISQYRPVDYAPTWTSYQCGNSFKPTAVAPPTYKCVGNPAQSAQSNPSTVSFQNACVERTCADLAGNNYEFNDGEPHIIPCDNQSGFWGQSTLVCSVTGQVSWLERCKYIKCKIPDGIDTKKNTTRDGEWVYFSSSQVELDCEAGFYYENDSTRPKYTCTYLASATERGVLTPFGSACQRITCQIPATGSQLSLNSAIDGGSVDWNGSAYIATTCKEGFYQTSADLAPSYSCSGSSKIGELRIRNPCAPVTCDLATSFGMLAKTNLEYGTNMTTSCNKPGYSGIVTYNCLNPVTAGKGVGRIVSSTCAESSCVANGNLLATFNTYVTPASGSEVIEGGAGGKISSTIGFLNGGNGGRTSLITTPASGASVAITRPRTSGSGGGGGSASMIAINKRIIAIAGGGGGGAGGGGVENPSDALAKVSDVENLEIRLNSNVFGPYFIGEMQYSPINGSAEGTAGISYNKLAISSSTDSTIFSLNPRTNPAVPGQIPAGTFVSDIFFASYGDPTINFTNPESLVLKDGACKDQNSLTQSLNQCGGKELCSFNTNAFSSCQSLATKKFGLVASYYFKEPTLHVVGSAGPRAFKIKEIRDNKDNIATDLVNGTVYTFSLRNGAWYKYPYRSDEYFIPEPVTSNKIRVGFRRTNKTFFPKLKTSQGSFPIKKLDESGNIASISVGYISTDKVYILTRNSSNWIIKEYTPEEVIPLSVQQRVPPTRSCMTIRISATGAENVAWSLPNSSCVNECPGYEIINGKGVGDNRIGVGATKHKTSQGDGIVYWNKTPAGTTVTKKFSTGLGIRNENDNYSVFQEINDILLTSDFRRGSTRQYFALSRKCNLDGSWEAPESLCVYNISGKSNDHGIPVDPASGTSYITSGEGYDQKYIIADSSQLIDQVQSFCKTGYDKQTTSDRYLYGNVGTYPPPKYNCVKDANKYEDRVYFNQVTDVNTRPCIQYCEVKTATHTRFPSITGKLNYKVKIDDSIELECNEGFLPSLSANGITRTNLKPTLTCLDKQGGTIDFSDTIAKNCTLANNCRYSSLTSGELNQITPPSPVPEGLSLVQGMNWAFNNQQIVQSWSEARIRLDEENPRTALHVNVDQFWFPVSKYINAEHRVGISHGGSGHTVNKCGYCKFTYNPSPGVTRWGYRRKILKSYSCNDGIWYFDWNNSDEQLDENGTMVPFHDRSCDGDNWDYWLHVGDWGGDWHPTNKHLGDCKETRSETSDFNFTTN